MVDVASLVTALQGVRTATEIVQHIRSVDESLEAAEQKLALADVVSALADAKIALSDVQEELHGKDQEIAELKKALELRKELVRFGDAYYEKNEEGFPIGDPYCSHCFEVKGVGVHLHIPQADRRSSECPACKIRIRRHDPRDGSNPNA
ncbi:hypothetical protein EQG41_19230 [Billgrantia azerbaijanica]|nr:hypothetical protein EQG41_19230 [Halomonas azerbaijanica]